MMMFSLGIVNHLRLRSYYWTLVHCLQPATDVSVFTTSHTDFSSGIVNATAKGLTTQKLQEPQFRVKVCRKPKRVKPIMKEDKLRSSVNWQWALKKGPKQMRVKKTLRVFPSNREISLFTRMAIMIKPQDDSVR